MTHHLPEIVWEIFDRSRYTKLPTALFPDILSQTQTSFPIGLILREQKELYAMTHPPLETDHFPVAIIPIKLLHKSEIWKDVLKLYPLPISDLAYYWKSYLEPRGN